MSDSRKTPTGTIGLSDVNTELGHASNKVINMNQTDVRKLAGKTTPNSVITMDDLRGKSNIIIHNFVVRKRVVQIGPPEQNMFLEVYGFSTHYANGGSVSPNIIEMPCGNKEIYSLEGQYPLWRPQDRVSVFSVKGSCSTSRVVLNIVGSSQKFTFPKGTYTDGIQLYPIARGSASDPFINFLKGKVNQTVQIYFTF